MIGSRDSLSLPSASSARGKVLAALAQRVSSGLHLGLLSYGDRLPSIREVAREFSVDPRVALAAYKELEQRGIVEMRTRSGIYVADPDIADTSGSSVRHAWLIDTVATGIAMGIAASDLARQISKSLETLRLRATVIECNDDQLFSVSNELERDYGLDVVTVDIAHLDDRLPVEARRADCIVTTIAHADQANELAAKLGVPALTLSMCEDLFAEVRRLLPLGPIYFVVCDERFEHKLRRIFESDSSRDNLRVLIVGRDDLNLIPHDAPTYLTRLTRQRLGHFPSLDRVIPESSVFSRVSSRELLKFIMGRNLAALDRRPLPLENRRKAAAV